MIFLFIISLIYCAEVSVLYGEDPNLYLSIVKGKSGGKSVRLISKERKLNLETIDIFYTSATSTPTKIESKKDGYICGKASDAGVVTCIDQKVKSEFTFEKDGNYVRVKADNGQCLTKAGLDSATGGFYLNLRDCNGKSEQRFIIKEVTSYEHGRQPPVYNLESYSHYNLPVSHHKPDETESHSALRGNCQLCRENKLFLEKINKIETLARVLKKYMKDTCYSTE